MDSRLWACAPGAGRELQLREQRKQEYGWGVRPFAHHAGLGAGDKVERSLTYGACK